MVPLLIWILVFVVSIIVLVKASDYFVDSSNVIGKKLRLPPFIIGVTLVAIGTSLPELASSIFAVFAGNSEIVIGNVIGSNIANIFLILGITAIFAKNIKILHEISHVDMPLLVGSAFFLAVTIWDGAFHLVETLLFIGGLILYLAYTVSQQEEEEDTVAKRKIKKNLSKTRFDVKTLVVFLLSGLFIFLGAKYTVDSVVMISGLLNIGVELIAVSAIALGTSLPELMVSLSAVRKGNSEIAVGNILGSSIFNIFAVIGISGLFGSLVIPPSMITFGLPMMLIATFMFFFVAQDKNISRWEGWMLVLFYVFFILKLFGIV